MTVAEATAALETFHAVEPSIASQSLVLELWIAGFTNSRKADLTTIQTDADKEMLSLRKVLIACPELRAFNTARRAIKEHARRHAQPNSALGPARWILPISQYEPCESGLRSLETIAMSAWNTYVDVYPAARENAKQRLKTQYNEHDYIDQDDLRGKFSVRWRYYTHGIDKALEKLNLAAYEEATRRLNEQMADAGKEYVGSLLFLLDESIKTMSERLAEGNVFRKDSKNKFEAALEVIERHKSVANSQQLDMMVAQARQLMAGADSKNLKAGSEMRTIVSDGLAAIRKQIEGLVGDKPIRQMALAE